MDQPSFQVHLESHGAPGWSHGFVLNVLAMDNDLIVDGG